MPSCSVSGCKRKYSGKGFCLLHYQRWRRHGDPKKVRRKKVRCKVADCKKYHWAKGYCPMHYYRWRRYGDPHVIKRNENPRCKMASCRKPHHAKNTEGYCLDHYRVWRIRQQRCTVKECKRVVRYKTGFCRKHQYHFDRYGNPLLAKAQKKRFCAQGGCKIQHYAKGMCYWHYHAQIPPTFFKLCTVPDCGRPYRAKGFCAKHYLAARREMVAK